MFLSVFDIFKIGIGPSSSHTVGPMVAARRFVEEDLRPLGDRASRLRVSLHGSLAFTGKGHGTDCAIALALAGEAPDTVDPDRVSTILASLADIRALATIGLPGVAFDPATDIEFDRRAPLPGHANGMSFQAVDEAGSVLTEQIFYSIGGGFVARADELAAAGGEGVAVVEAANPQVPYPFANATEMLAMGAASRLSIADMKRTNEQVRALGADLDFALDRIWSAMETCMNRGLGQAGTLPGGLKVKRRA